eukprot:396140-Prymnesium_polylepis.1
MPTPLDTSDAHLGPPRELSEGSSRVVWCQDANRSAKVCQRCAKLRDSCQDKWYQCPKCVRTHFQDHHQKRLDREVQPR